MKRKSVKKHRTARGSAKAKPPRIVVKRSETPWLDTSHVPHVVKLHTAGKKKIAVVVPGGYVADLISEPIVKVETVGPWTEAWRVLASFFK